MFSALSTTESKSNKHSHSAAQQLKTINKRKRNTKSPAVTSIDYSSRALPIGQFLFPDNCRRAGRPAAATSGSESGAHQRRPTCATVSCKVCWLVSRAELDGARAELAATHATNLQMCAQHEATHARPPGANNRVYLFVY